MLRVLMLCKACVVGIYQRKLELIAAQNIDLSVIVPHFWRDERGKQPLERVYTQGYDLQATSIRFNGNFHLYHFPNLVKQIEAFHPHVIHIDEEPYNFAAWHALYHARKVNAKTVFFCWQNIQRHYPPPFSWGERWALHHVDHLLVGTDDAGTVWRDKGYIGDLSVIPQFGIDPDLFQLQQDKPDRPFTIGYIGRLVEEKGIHHLLEAASRLTVDWRLRLVGGGPMRATLNQQANTLGIADRIEFIGQIPSTVMPSEYQQLDVLVLPSLTRPNWKEQFGRVLIEAMASGVPVIGSDSGAIPGVIGDAGLVFRESDVDALHNALTQLSDNADLREQLKKRGRAHVIQHYTHQSVADATVEVYRQLANE